MWVFSTHAHALAAAVLQFLPLGKMSLRWSCVVWHVGFVTSLKLNVPNVFSSIVESPKNVEIGMPSNLQD